MSTDRSFTAALVQMRTGLMPEPSLEQASRLIRDAAAQGADYVQTPEVSNMMQLNRAALFEHLRSEEGVPKRGTKPPPASTRTWVPKPPQYFPEWPSQRPLFFCGAGTRSRLEFRAKWRDVASDLEGGTSDSA